MIVLLSGSLLDLVIWFKRSILKRGDHIFQYRLFFLEMEPNWIPNLQLIGFIVWIIAFFPTVQKMKQQPLNLKGLTTFWAMCFLAPVDEKINTAVMSVCFVWS